MEQQVNNILEIEDLYVEYKSERSTVRALNGVTLTLAKGESLGLVGESGAGKTTTALSILNLLPKDAAVIKKGRCEVSWQVSIPDVQRGTSTYARWKIAMIFQIH